MSKMYKYKNYDNEKGVLLFTEFRYYNKKKEIIKEETLLELKKQASEKTFIYWTNEIYSKNGIIFKVYKEAKQNREGKDIWEYYVSLIDINCSFESEELFKCKQLFRQIFIQFDITNEQFMVLEKIYEKIVLGDRILILKSWEQFINYFIENDIYYAWEDIWDFNVYQQHIKTLFDITFEKPSYDRYCDSTNCSVCYILKVLEKRINDINYRIAIYLKVGRYDNYGCIKVFKDTNIYYNAIEEGRIFFGKLDIPKLYFIPQEFNRRNNEGQLIFPNKLINRLWRNINELLSNEEYIITPQIWKFYNDRVMLYEFSSGGLTEHEKKIIQQYLKLLKEGKQIKIGQVIIETGKITIEGIFCMEFNKSFLNIVDVFTSLKAMLKNPDVRYNFNTFYEHLLKLSELRHIDINNVRETVYKEWKTIKFKINNVNVEVTKENDRMYINGIFSRISDVFYIVGKAVCFGTEEDFNNYIKDVSYIGIEWKHMINNGILIILENPFSEIHKKIGISEFKELHLRFSLSWDNEHRRNIYLLLNGNEILIKYKQKFKTAFNQPHIRLRIKYLKEILDESLDGVTDEDIISIIDNAIEEGKIIKQRGEQLVNETIMETKAERNKIIINGLTKEGFIIIGNRTNTKYFINMESLEVYKWDNGTWNRRCVVDDYRKQRIFEDRLANRLINIYNEHKTVTTLFN